MFRTALSQAECCPVRRWVRLNAGRYGAESGWVLPGTALSQAECFLAQYCFWVPVYCLLRKQYFPEFIACLKAQYLHTTVAWWKYSISRAKKFKSPINKCSIKGIASQDFRPLFFCLKDSTWTPYEQAKNGLTTTSWTQTFFFRFANTPKYLFPLIVPLKSVKSLQSSEESVCVVLSVWSTTTPTPCPRSQWIRVHYVRVFNVSA